MREELLAHVACAFEDELPRCGDENTALIQVEKRFGDPRELAQKLQATVPTIDRVEFFVAQLYKPRAGEPILRRASRYSFISIAIYLSLTIPVVALVLPFLVKFSMLGKAVLGVVITSIPYGQVTFLATLLSIGLQQTLFEKSGRSILKGGLLVLLSCLFTVFLPIEFALGLLPFLSVADCIAVGFSTLKVIWPSILLCPLAFVIVAKMISDENRYINEWAGLQLD